MENAGKAKIRILKGAGKGKEFLIETTPFYIGRGEEVSLNRSSEGLRLELPDQSKSISRKHAKIVIQGEAYQIIDTSVNGTLLNGTKVAFGDLHSNSTFEVGNEDGAVMFEFILLQKEEAFTHSRPTLPSRPHPAQSPNPPQSFQPSQTPRPAQPSHPSQPFHSTQPSQGNPFLEFTKISPHFRQGETSESLSTSSTFSWKWIGIISLGIIVLFLLILFVF